MVVVRLRSPVSAALLALGLLLGAGLGLFRIDHVWSVRTTEVVKGPWGTEDGQFGRGPGADGRQRGPQAVAVDGLGHIVVADSLNYRLQIFDHAGRLLQVVPLPAGAVSSWTEDERAAAYGRLVPCFDWSSGFWFRPDIAAPARPTSGSVAALGGGRPGGPPYVTDIDLAGGAWRVDRDSGTIDPDTGPEVYLLAGWEGAALAIDVTGEVKWARDLSTPSRFNELRDPYDPRAPVTPASWAGFLLDLDRLPRGGVVVAGYELLTDKLVYFIRALPDPRGEPVELAAYQLTRDGSVKIDENLPIALEVESMAVGADGLLYVVAAAPAPPDRPAAEASPFTREIWVYSPEGRFKNKIELEFEAYTRHLGLIGVDSRGLVFLRVSSPGKAGRLAVYNGEGCAVASVPLPEGVETADTYLGPDGAVYVSQASAEGFKVVRHVVQSRSRLVPRLWGRR